MFIVYPFDKQDQLYIASKKSYQRWERCRMNLRNNHRPSLEALYAMKYFNKNIEESAKDFIKEAVRDVTAELYTNDLINDTIKDEVDQKINTIKYIIGYPDEILNLEKIEEFYEELDLDGTEGSVATYLKMEEYNQKIQNDAISSWKRKLSSILGDDDEIKFDTTENIICKFEELLQKIFLIKNLLLNFRYSSNVDPLSLLPSKSFEILQHSNFI